MRRRRRETGRAFDVECRGDRPWVEGVAYLAGCAGGDIEGDHQSQRDGHWTRLAMTPAGGGPRMVIEPVTLDPLVLRVSSDDAKLSWSVACFIAMETQGKIA